MSIPPFEEFCETIKPEDSEKMVMNAVDGLGGSYNLRSQEEMAALVGKIIGASNTMIYDVLERYHQWLSQQLEQQPHDLN